MKVLGTKAVVILVLSLAIWYFFYVSFPSSPPTADESVVIVGFVGLVVLGVPFLVSRLRRGPRKAEPETPAAKSAEVEA